MKRKNRNAQSILEYALLVIVVAGALLAMKTYILRSVQAKYRQGADVFGEGEQYAKGVTKVTNLDRTNDISIDTASLYPLSCAAAKAKADGLNNQLDDINAKIAALNKNAEETEAKIAELKDGLKKSNDEIQSLRDMATDRENSAKQKRSSAAELAKTANKYQAQVDEAIRCEREREEYRRGRRREPPKDCPAKNLSSGQINSLNNQIFLLRMQIDTLNQEAAQLESEAKNITAQADSLEELTNAVTDQTPELQKRLDGIRDKVADLEGTADNYQAQIDNFKKNYADCFAQ